VFPEFDSIRGKRLVYSDEEVRRRLNAVSEGMRSQGFFEREIIKVTDRLQAEVKPRFTEAVEELLDQELKLGSREKRVRFYNFLLRAWCIREADNERAWKDREFRNACLNITLPREQVLDLTFLYSEILDMVPDIRASLDESRKELSPSIMSFR